jgi:hypothetical protein
MASIGSKSRFACAQWIDTPLFPAQILLRRAGESGASAMLRRFQSLASARGAGQFVNASRSTDRGTVDPGEESQHLSCWTALSPGLKVAQQLPMFYFVRGDGRRS